MVEYLYKKAKKWTYVKETKPRAEWARGWAVDWGGGCSCIRGHVTCHCCVSPVSRVTWPVHRVNVCMQVLHSGQRPAPRPPLLTGHSSSMDPPVADMCEPGATLSDNVEQY